MFFYVSFVCVMLLACTRKEFINPPKNENVQRLTTQNFGDLPTVIYKLEDCEKGSKTGYAVGNVTLTTGSWNLDDALIGTLSTDRKVGTKSFRVRNSGSISMNFNIDSVDVKNIVVYHATYGTDGPSQWRLFYSSNDGIDWKPIGDTITSSDSTLQQQVYANPAFEGSKVRFQIKKLGGTGRINFDNFIVAGGITYTTPPAPLPTGTRDDNMAMGNPSDAAANPADSNNYLMRKDMYALAYNNSKGTSNWVSWHLSTAWLGSASRCDCFSADSTLPMGYCSPNERSYDFTTNGFDRGHMCPSADRSLNSTENSATFLMTNMVPQAPESNQGPWGKLEGYCRTLAKAGNELYIISGPRGMGGEGNKGLFNTIGMGKITVPTSTWKVIVVLPNGNDDVNRVSATTRVIAIDMPNKNSVKGTDWGSYRTTVRDIESKTGFDFLSKVPKSIQDVVETKVDAGPTM